MMVKKRKLDSVKENMETVPPPSLWTAFALPIYGKSCGERLVFLIMEMTLQADCRIQFDQVTMERFTDSDRQAMLHGTWSLIETKSIDRRLGALLYPYRHVQNAWLPSCYSLQLESLKLEIPLIFRTTLKSLVSRNERPDRWFQVHPFKQASGGIRRLVHSLTDHGADFTTFFDERHLWGKLPLTIPFSDTVFSVKRSVPFVSRLLTFPVDITIPRGGLRHVFVYPFGDRLNEPDLSAVLLDRPPPHDRTNFDRWSYVARLDECIEHLIMNLLPTVPYLSMLFSYLINVATMQEGHTSVDQVAIKYLVAFFRFVAHSPSGCLPAVLHQRRSNHVPRVPWFQFPRVSVVTQCGHVFGHRPWIDPPIFHVTHCPQCRVQMHTADVITFRNPFYTTETDQEIRKTALDFLATAICIPHPIILDPALIAAACARRKPLPNLLPKPVSVTPSSCPVLTPPPALACDPPSSPPFVSWERDDDDDDNDGATDVLSSVDDWYENDPYYLNAVITPPVEQCPPLRVCF